MTNLSNPASVEEPPPACEGGDSHGVWRSLPFYREDFALLAISLAIIAITSAMLTMFSAALPRLIDYGLNTVAYLPALFTVVMVDLYVRSARRKPERLWEFGYSRAKRRSYAGRILAAMPVLIAISIFMPIFSSLKSSIELFHPFNWDDTWIALDRSIHGADPWRLLQPYLGYPFVTSFLSRAYQFWFMLIYAGPVWFAIFQTNRTLRLRFFLGYFLTWTICGMVLAVFLASVGPCFVEPLLGNPYYAEQMAYLHSVHRHNPLFVIEIQDQLLAWYRAGDHSLGRGITAMPSMHVALSVLYALAMRKVSKPLGWLFAGFAVIILLASVHLGYHYAVDGYAAAIITLVIWGFTAPLAKWLRAASSAASAPGNPRRRQENRAAAAA
jgi:hypothetical protein